MLPPDVPSRSSRRTDETSKAWLGFMIAHKKLIWNLTTRLKEKQALVRLESLAMFVACLCTAEVRELPLII